MTLKEINSKEFPDKKVFTGLKDSFGKKFLVVVNEDLQEIRCLAKYNDYQKRVNSLARMNLRHVIPQKFGEVINLTAETANKIESSFPGYKHTQWEICC